MTHMRYWALTFAVAIGGAFIAIERFAFAPTNAIWIAFAVAAGAVVFSLAATLVALLRDNQAFAGLSAISALVAAWTLIATRTFTAPTALWLAFAGGAALLALSLRALALHEATVERGVHRLDVNGFGGPRGVRRGQPVHLAARHVRTITPLARVRGRGCGRCDRSRPAAGRLRGHWAYEPDHLAGGRDRAHRHRRGRGGGPDRPDRSARRRQPALVDVRPRSRPRRRRTAGVDRARALQRAGPPRTRGRRINGRRPRRRGRLNPTRKREGRFSAAPLVKRVNGRAQQSQASQLGRAGLVSVERPR